MRFELKEQNLVLHAMEQSFDPDDLASVLLQRFGKKYVTYTATTKKWPTQVQDVYEHFNAHYTSEQLLAALMDARPRVPEFAQVAAVIGSVRALDTAGLEVLVRDDDVPYQDVAAFLAGVNKRASAVCRVLCAGKTGTGTLIAPDLVITNRHVVAGALGHDDAITKSITCRFDDRTNATGSYTTPKTDVGVIAVPASRPHAPEDTRVGAMTTSGSALDYALLRLERKIDTLPIIIDGGEARGFVEPSDRATTVGEAAVVLQHPGGQPMKIDLGGVTEVSTYRLRHSVNTEQGSSGAPVFDARLRMIAIHHAGHKDGPGPALTYNQAIPLGPILADARERGVEI
jgi:hypothetical protein